MGQSLLQSGAGITKWSNVITSWGKYYKVGELLQSRVAQREHLNERTTLLDTSFKTIIFLDKLYFWEIVKIIPSTKH